VDKTFSITDKQKERLMFIRESSSPITYESNTRMHNTLLNKGWVELYKIPLSGVQACYSTIISYVRVTYLGKQILDNK
jgi:hypothetical protein